MAFKAFPKIVPIGDIHFPYESQRSVDLTVEYVDAEQPDIIVQCGDLYDFFSWGRFPRSLNPMTPKQEIARSIKRAQIFWDRIRKAAPKAKLFQLRGNHDERPYKQIIAKAPEFEEFVIQTVDSMFEFDGVTVHDTEKDELIIKNICFQHGFRRVGTHTHHNKMHTVVGHYHQGYVIPYRLGTETLFELNCGYIANPFSVAMSYARSKRFSTWTQGIGQWDKYGPRFIAFPNPRFNP